jgi:hypothetical protein
VALGPRNARQGTSDSATRTETAVALNKATLSRDYLSLESACLQLNQSRILDCILSAFPDRRKRNYPQAHALYGVFTALRERSHVVVGCRVSAHTRSLRAYKALRSLRRGYGDPLVVVSAVVGPVIGAALAESACTGALHAREAPQNARDLRSRAAIRVLCAAMLAIGLQSAGRSGTGLLHSLSGVSRRHCQRQLVALESAGLTRWQPPRDSGAPHGPSGHCYAQWAWPGAIVRGAKRVETPPVAVAATHAGETEYQRQRAHTQSAEDASAADAALAAILALRTRSGPPRT